MSTCRFFLKADWQEKDDWTEVTKEKFIRAERAAGFRPKGDGDGLATGGFSDGGVSGKIEVVPDQADHRHDPPLNEVDGCDRSLPILVGRQGRRPALSDEQIKEIAKDAWLNWWAGGPRPVGAGIRIAIAEVMAAIQSDEAGSVRCLLVYRAHDGLFGVDEPGGNRAVMGWDDLHPFLAAVFDESDEGA